ncbi:MAG: hypothetical protein WCK19_17635, partial [Chloroflexota bacterium]
MQTLKVTAGKKKAIIAGLAVIALLIGLFGAVGATAYTPPDVTADKVWGQGGVFNTNNAPTPPSATSLNGSYGVAVAADGGIYIADNANNRVLYYPATNGIPDFTATRVYGQGGDFTTGTNNKGTRTAISLYGPRGIALASDGGLYVADRDNNRVLYYSAGSTTATRVYGQGGDFTTGTNN